MRFEDYWYDEWLRRCIVKLHNQTGATGPLVDELVLVLLDQLEESREASDRPCMWCGAVNTHVGQHYVACRKRQEMYKV